MVDDEKDLPIAIGEGLSSLSYDVSLSKDGEQSIKLYTNAYNQKQSFDIVILDLTIPGGMGGKKTLQELLKINPNVKAIVVTLEIRLWLDIKSMDFKGC